INKLYIIIITFNAIKWLDKCLSDCKNYPIIIVDNGSVDGTLQFINDNFPSTILLSQPSNLGFGKANNLGIKHALEQGAEYVFLLNQDAFLQDGCIDELISVHKQNPEYGILS